VTESHREREYNTLEAIKSLQDKYPFATGLLIYCLIERMLKYFIISEIDNTQSILKVEFRHALKNSRDKGEEELRRRLELTLEKIEQKFDKNSAQKIKYFIKEIAGRRNDYMHSNLLFPPKVEIDKEKRSDKHKIMLLQSIEDLKCTFDLLGDKYKVVTDGNGMISDFLLR
jgi:hypothetical protein